MSDHSSAYQVNDPQTTEPFTICDLPFDNQGRIYHLQLKPEDIAPDILLVGDPGRAEMIGTTILRDLEIEHEHRGLATFTGTSAVTGERATIISPIKTTVSTSGIGTPSLEIVLSELVILNEIDFQTRTRKPKFPRLNVIRVGTSGGLQSATKLGTPIITSYAIGMDNTGLFYEAPYPDETCERLEREIDDLIHGVMPTESRFHGKVHPYVSRAEPVLVDAMVEAAEQLGVTTKLGLTVSFSGFFAPQGRDIARIKPTIPDADHIFSAYDPRINGQRIENMEMEASFLIHFLGGLGHWGGAICAAIANRRSDTFYSGYKEAIVNTTNVALLTLATIRSRHPEDSLPG